MQEFNIINLLNKFSGEIILCVLIACCLAIIMKKFLKFSNKILIFISFILGFALYLFTGIVLLKQVILTSFVNGVTAGGLSVCVTLVIKKYARLGEDDIKKLIENLLSSIVLSEQLDEVVDNILEKLSSSKELTKEGLKELISKNLNASLSEEERLLATSKQ